METLRRIQIEALRLKISQPLIFSFIIIFVAPTFTVWVFSNLTLGNASISAGGRVANFLIPQNASSLCMVDTLPDAPETVVRADRMFVI